MQLARKVYLKSLCYTSELQSFILSRKVKPMDHYKYFEKNVLFERLKKNDLMFLETYVFIAFTIMKQIILEVEINDA